ncbi:serpin family protein [Kipferlia bialata]|uniref:Serpin family protein n=1 Tax=Kipferlia bialata TaxID=797122 RepID=A0A9K3D547_9EUKA|nr:serpin family protein [Kipferlia bialata]|eukprot:g11116.t1
MCKTVSAQEFHQLYSAIRLDVNVLGSGGVTKVLEGVQQDKAIEIGANVFARNCHPTPAYIKGVIKAFGCEPCALKSAAQVNAWCASATHNHIQKIVDNIDNVDAILISAIFFKAAWKTPFNKRSTRPQLFTPFSGKGKEVPMMHKNEKMQYKHVNGMQLVVLPYNDSGVTAVIGLPDAKGPEALAAAGSALLTPGCVTGTYSTKVTLALPKFKMESSHELLPMLKGMGVPTAGLDCTHSLGCPMDISSVIQKAILIVDEEGTTAAAVTAVMMKRGCARPEPKTEVICDRPFWFLLFLGDTLLFKAAKCEA